MYICINHNILNDKERVIYIADTFENVSHLPMQSYDLLEPFAMNHGQVISLRDRHGLNITLRGDISFTIT